MATFTLRPQGPFSLEQSVLFGFGQRHSETWIGAIAPGTTAEPSPAEQASA